MRVHLSLYFNWIDPDMETQVAEEVTDGGCFPYSGGIPPLVGDEVEWHPDKVDDAPSGVYVVFSRRLIVGRHVEDHWVVSARWTSSE